MAKHCTSSADKPIIRYQNVCNAVYLKNICSHTLVLPVNSAVEKSKGAKVHRKYIYGNEEINVKCGTNKQECVLQSTKTSHTLTHTQMSETECHQGTIYM